MVTEQLKQRITAKTGKLKRYKARVTQYRQKKMFRSNQEALYEELGVNCREGSDPTSADNARKVWSEIWDKRGQYKEDTEGWLRSKRNCKWQRFKAT